MTVQRLYTPDDNTAGLAALAKQVEDLRQELLFGEGVDDDTLYPAAEQHLLSAIAQLDLARRSLKLAERHQGLGD